MMTVQEQLDTKTMPVTESGCLLWIGYCDRDGYGKFQVNGKKLRAHRAAWEACNGDIPAGTSVLHKCDVPQCVNVLHLFLGTQQDNGADMAQKGRSLFGAKHNMAKLTESSVHFIRQAKLPQKKLAEHFGVSIATISMIKSRKVWGRLK